MNELNFKSVFYFLLTAFFVVFASSFLLVDLHAINNHYFINLMNQLIIPVIICFILMCFINIFDFSILKYILFSLISITSYFGFTKTLTGSHSESANVIFYGLSFYTASIAYQLAIGKNKISNAFLFANPLLIVTGPILTSISNIKHKKIYTRLRYFLPFLVLGLFLHQTIATPLTETFSLINKTDLASVVAYATIFELFVYANFCGLSLIVYAICGIFGYKIPLNFKQPFSSNNVIDFWKGWHISLSLVLKTLFYMPIKNKLGFPAAIFATYIASAFWHGVSFNFLIWGCFHAFVFLLTRWVLERKIKYLPLVLLFFGIIMGRLIFSDANTDRLLEKLKFIYTDFSIIAHIKIMPNLTKLALFLIFTFVAFEFFCQKSFYFKQRNYKFYRLPIIQLILLVFIVLTMSATLGVNYAVYGQR